MKVNEINFSNLKWLDVQAPHEKKLIEIAKVLGIPSGMILNCLNPDYLPNIDVFGDVYFIMLRVSEPHMKSSADSIQELTTKIAVFIKGNLIYTFHRLPLNEIDHLIQKINENKDDPSKNDSQSDFIQILMEQVASSYNDPINKLEYETDHFEANILASKKTKNLLKDGFLIKRKASAYKKVIKFTLDTLVKLELKMNIDSNRFGYIKEKLERYQFYADDIFENIQGLLNLYIAIQSQKTNEASFKTNEIVRVLTVLTIFFLPLNFLAGIYGMNFEHMPLLKEYNGFWFALGFMAFICFGLLYYVSRKGWLAPPPKE